ncbi:MAG TPA: hypothetical protein VH639_17655 [Bryobacteraceae bacterium]|jgi:hypothetical protein
MNSQRVEGLEEYNARIEGVYDSLKGFHSATEEARARCEKAMQACEESRSACRREMAQYAALRSPGDCSERDKLEDDYRAALLAYDEALSAVRLPAGTPGAEEIERIDEARTVSRAAIALWDEHRRRHGCDRGRSSRGTATGRAL